MSETGGPTKNTSPDSRADLDQKSNLDATVEGSLPTETSATVSPTTSAHPTNIGPYRLIRKLGEGGMGQVWLAEQTEPVKRTVALKLTRVGWYDDEVLQRFHAERQSLALMDHPSIAKVFDAGSTPDGQPYLVMEYVRGVPITQYCDQKQLTIKERLELFIKVCEGVQHAHQKAIIHRDLKPANILVTEVDGKPVPRIIDFGVAKATGPDIGGKTVMTRVGGFVGTPGYMSPEQASGTADVDTRTDVYSLGVILYVLLTGVEPLETTRWNSQPLHEVLREIREVDPPRPSTRVRTALPSSSNAQLRGVQLKQLEDLLQGDLDWIALKALEKDRVRRYSTPTELATDINAYLVNQPVSARPTSAAYRVQKYVRRNRLAVAVGMLLVLLLAGFAGIQAVQLRRIAKERDRANHNAEIAEKNRSEATKQAQLALDTIYQVVTNTDEKLGTVAGTGELRKDLIESAMKNLDGISRTAATAAWADRTTGVALQRMAAFYEQMGMSNQETEVLQRSLQIFNRLMKEDPNQDWNIFDASISYDSLGEIGRETEPDPAKIYQYYEFSRGLRLQLAKTIHQEPPTLFQRLRSLMVSEIKLSALALELHDPAKALNYAQDALDTGSQLASAKAPNPNATLELFSSGYFHRGRAQLLIGREALAREDYKKAESLQADWVRSEPLNDYARQELARTNLAIGEMELGLGKVQLSLDRLRRAEKVFAELNSKDKTNDELKWYLANTQYAIGNALYSAGKPYEAKAYFQRCLLTRQAQLRATPSNIQRRIELMLVNAQLGNTQDALNDARVVEQYAPRNPGKLFAAASAYALSARTSNVDRKKQEYCDGTVRIMHLAIANGFRDVDTSTRPGVRNSAQLRRLQTAFADTLDRWARNTRSITSSAGSHSGTAQVLTSRSNSKEISSKTRKECGWTKRI
jgi:serine/threonine protein kinase